VLSVRVGGQVEDVGLRSGIHESANECVCCH
jgi:hypothetical protein